MKSMLLTGLAAATASLVAFSPAPVTAQVSPGVLVIFGNDKCPTNANGEEIVVCKRLDEGERYRVPKDLRELAPSPDNKSWAVRQQSTLDAAQTGIGSCSNVGPGGMTGCFAKDAAAAKAERKQRAKDSNPLD